GGSSAVEAEADAAAIVE
ncbi:MAG: ribosomal protein S5, partial [Porphyrobacter sp. HL-46]